MAFEHNPNLPSVREVIPHRPPHLWLDGVLEMKEGYAKGFWTPGPEHYEGHFEGEIQILPGVKQIESIAQIGAYALMAENPGETLPLFSGIEDARFLSSVFPGDTLMVEVGDFQRQKREFTAWGSATVGAETVCEVSISGLVLPKKVAIRMLEHARESRRIDSPKPE